MLLHFSSAVSSLFFLKLGSCVKALTVYNYEFILDHLLIISHMQCLFSVRSPCSVNSAFFTALSVFCSLSASL